MDNAIAVTRETDFSGLRLERSDTGIVRTPWFSFEIGDIPVADYDSSYHRIIGQSKYAFADLLKINVGDVMVSQMNDQADPHLRHWWRLSTRGSVALPKPKALPKPTKPVLPENRGAIDI